MPRSGRGSRRARRCAGGRTSPPGARTPQSSHARGPHAADEAPVLAVLERGDDARERHRHARDGIVGQVRRQDQADPVEDAAPRCSPSVIVKGGASKTGQVSDFASDLPAACPGRGRARRSDGKPAPHHHDVFHRTVRPPMNSCRRFKIGLIAPGPVDGDRVGRTGPRSGLRSRGATPALPRSGQKRGLVLRRRHDPRGPPTVKPRRRARRDRSHGRPAAALPCGHAPSQALTRWPTPPRWSPRP